MKTAIDRIEAMLSLMKRPGLILLTILLTSASVWAQRPLPDAFYSKQIDRWFPRIDMDQDVDANINFLTAGGTVMHEHERRPAFTRVLTSLNYHNLPVDSMYIMIDTASTEYQGVPLTENLTYAVGMRPYSTKKARRLTRKFRRFMWFHGYRWEKHETMVTRDGSYIGKKYHFFPRKNKGDVHITMIWMEDAQYPYLELAAHY